MIVSAKTVGVGANGLMELYEIPTASISVSFPCLISIDGSTSTTGVGIIRLTDGAMVYSLSFTREKGETPVQYKVRLKREVYSILSLNPFIQKVFYEEPFIGYASAAPNLFMLRTFVEELVVEYEPQFDKLSRAEINNLKWKHLFLAPDKVPSGTEAQKLAVRTKLVSFLPFLSGVTQDEIDAIAMGFCAAVKLRGGVEEELASKKKQRPFMYNQQFIGADDDDVMLQEMVETYTGPKKLLECGISLIELKNKGDFDKQVYSAMGDLDKIVIAKFKSNCYGNIVLQHRIGHLTQQFGYIYAVIWRKSRK